MRPFIESNPFRPRACCGSAASKENGTTAVPSVSPAAGVSKFSFLEAIELVLTTGPLSKERLRDAGKAAALTSEPPAVTSSSRETKAVAAKDSDGGDRDGVRSSSFVGFGHDVEAPVIAAVTELLQEATAAAERWGLPLRERESLQAWSRAAGATTTTKTVVTAANVAC